MTFKTLDPAEDIARALTIAGRNTANIVRCAETDGFFASAAFSPEIL
jgi:hypothetical protein